MPDYWIGVASKDHVKAGEKGGFSQLGHGKESAVKRLKKGDWIAYYCPRTKMKGGDAVQAFCSIGEITSEDPYQVKISSDFKPYRVNVDYRVSANQADVRPLLDKMELTKDLGKKWGMAFRRSKIHVSKTDFALIGRAMGLTAFS